MVLEHVERQYGLTEEQVIIELLGINGGKPGYYLANLRDKKYYYCGLLWSDVKTTLQELGIGRTDLLEKQLRGDYSRACDRFFLLQIFTVCFWGEL